MAKEVHVEATEGNDIWFAHRITLPNQQYLQLSDLAPSGDLIVIKLVRDSAHGAARRTKTTFSTTSDSTAASCIFDTLQYTYWDGYDDIGYNFLYQLPATGTNGSETWTLEGGNTYYIEFEVATEDFGKIRWANKIEVRGLISQ
jgi:hypothetical protein